MLQRPCYVSAENTETEPRCVVDERWLPQTKSTGMVTPLRLVEPAIYKFFSGEFLHRDGASAKTRGIARPKSQQVVDSKVYRTPNSYLE
jgi:hypothetical protein